MRVMKLLKILLFFFVFSSHLVLAQDGYEFDLSEIEDELEKKPYSFDGYFEFRPNFLWLDDDAALYALRFYDRSRISRLEEYNFRLLLDANYETRVSDFFLRTNVEANSSDLGSDVDTRIFEGYALLKPSPFLSFYLGKKTLNWGKGYAWNPVAFVGRPKDPDEPDLALEGFVMASADYIKSFDGPLQTITFTPAFIPVYRNINDDFGEINNVNFACKIYFLLYDTDIDFMFLIGGSKPSRFGMDFSRNITTNFEIHGEFAYVNNLKKKFIDSDGSLFDDTFDAKSYLAGIRYLTASDTTLICEYYRNGAGFTTNEMEDFFIFIDKGQDTFLTSGDDALLRKAISLAEERYGRRNPTRDYLYLGINQKEPFDILYFTPSITWISNINDRSYTLSPQLLYTGITNLELRLKGGFIVGDGETEYGEKQNEYRLELRVRHYFDAITIFDRVG